MSAGADIIIIGTETLTTLPELERLRDAIAVDKLILSLDIADRRVLSGADSLKDLEPLRALELLVIEGLERFILLTLDAVGTGEGPDLSLLRRAKQSFPRHTLIAGGGIKKPEHLRALATAKVDGVLVATSLHRGWITGRDIAALK
jgi:phosphoribosylformimino-5-aminoimidazole carboxamide ribotide isomerase